MFSGLHERQLDDKGRVALPATYRSELGDRCYLVFGQNRCIDVWSAAEFEATADSIRDRVLRGDLPLERQRAHHHSATEAVVDRQGRVKVDERLREYAHLALSSKVIVAGNHNRIELWSEGIYADIADQLTAALARGPE